MAQVKKYAYGLREINRDNTFQQSSWDLVQKFNEEAILYLLTTDDDITYKTLYNNMLESCESINYNTKNQSFEYSLGCTRESFNDDVNNTLEHGIHVACHYDEIEKQESFFKRDHKEVFNMDNPMLIWNGTYPFMTYNIVRIGNKEYEFLTFSQ